MRELPMELLEHIMLCLPMKTLLLSQRVSRSWKSLIDKSPLLQQALFLQPAPCGALYWQCAELEALKGQGAHSVPVLRTIRDDPLDSETRTIIPMLSPQSRRHNRLTKHCPPHWGYSAVDSGRYTVFLNPLIASKIADFSRPVESWAPRSPRALIPVPRYLRMNYSRFHEKAVSYEHASWRRMSITQPPVRLICYPDGLNPKLNIERKLHTFVPVFEDDIGQFGFGAEQMLFESQMLSGLGEAWGVDEWQTWTNGTDLERIDREDDAR